MFFDGFPVLVDEGQGKAHYVEVIAFNAPDEFGRQTLNRVCAGFVHGLAGGDVIVDFAAIEFDEVDLRRLDVDDCAGRVA